MSEKEPVVFVVDDDSSVREAMQSLIRSAGLQVRTFSSAREFLQSKPSDLHGCLVLDVRLPGLSGLELQRELNGADIRIPIIFISGHADIHMSVKAMKAGAMEFLTKPFGDQELLDSIHLAITRDRIALQARVEMGGLRERLDLLTPREREVMRLVVSGLPNKQIAAKLGTSEITIKVHRAKVMNKMRAASLPDLVRMAERIETGTVK